MSKKGKASGSDQIPIEVLRNDTSVSIYMFYLTCVSIKDYTLDVE